MPILHVLSNNLYTHLALLHSSSLHNGNISVAPYLKHTFLVMTTLHGRYKALIVASDEHYARLQADIKDLFGLQELPALRVRWVEERYWSVWEILVYDKFDAMLKLVRARGSKDSIQAC